MQKCIFKTVAGHQCKRPSSNDTKFCTQHQEQFISKGLTVNDIKKMF